MKLYLFACVMRLCDRVSRLLFALEKRNQGLRSWAWHHCTRLNLATCNTRAAKRQ